MLHAVFLYIHQHYNKPKLTSKNSLELSASVKHVEWILSSFMLQVIRSPFLTVK